PPPATAAVQHRALDLVPALGQGALDALDESAEVGVGRPGIHLGDEEDLQARWASYVPKTSRSPLQISPIVHPARNASRIGGSRFSVPSEARRTSARARAASSAFLSDRTVAVRSSWRRSESGSSRWSSIGSDSSSR